MDDLCQTRAATQRNPPQLPLRLLHIRWQDRVTNTWSAGWLTEHAITAHSVMPSMARPCTSHGARPPAKRNAFNCMDVMAVLPTGFRKPLIFQMFVMMCRVRNKRKRRTGFSGAIVIFPFQVSYAIK